MHPVLDIAKGMNSLADPLMFDAGEKDFLHNNHRVHHASQLYKEAIRKIDELDLSTVKMKLCLPMEKEGKGWTQQEADDCERFYKMFLKLHVIYPSGVRIVPTKEIDEMWHAHILDTRKYHQDCELIFGWYLHHFPYFGLRSEEDAINLHRSFDRLARSS